MVTITNLHSNPGDIDNPNHGWNWWEDYCEWLVNNQKANGSWDGYSYWTGPMATGWNINILAATKIPGGNGGEVPEPGTMLLVGFGLAGLAIARKRMRQ